MLEGSARRRVVRLATLVLLTGAAWRADGQQPDPAASTPVVRLFTGGRVIVGDGRVIEDGAFLVRGERIVRVGSAAEVVAPPAAGVVDLAGRTVMPALVNTHAHLGWEAYASWGSGNFTRENLIDHLYRHAYYGVGTIISTGSDREEIALEVRQAQRAGEVGGAPLPGVARARDARRRTEPQVHERRRMVGAARREQRRGGAGGGAGRGRAGHPDPQDLGRRARRAAGGRG